MKNKVIFPIIVSSISLAGLIAFSVVSKDALKVEAYNASSLTTTIDLNDCTDQEIRAYYNGVENLDNFDLLRKLKTILKKDQKYYNYDSGDNIWKMYEITDRDWEKSPASSTTYGTYDSATNTITSYQYGSNSSPKNSPYIHALYVNRDVENETRAWDDHGQTQWGINREHVWAKAQGFDENVTSEGGKGGARGDPMHLMAGNGYVNNIHGNFYYGYVDKTQSYKDCGAEQTKTSGEKFTWANLSGNLLGKSKYQGGSVSVFEPQDSDKGDIARAIFYMVARYNNLAGDDTIDSNNPNLELVNDLTSYSSTAYTSTATKKGKMGLIADLLEWNRLDPPDEYEIHRNNLLYKNYTNNRNPFIDFPSWAEAIWGTSENGVWNPTPTVKASASTDSINGDKYSLSTNSVTFSDLSKTTTISVRSSKNIQVTWEIADTSIATIDKTVTAANEEVTITPVKDGSTVLKVTIKISETETVIKNVNITVSTPKQIDPQLLMIIAIVVGVVIVVIIIVLIVSKSARKAAKKLIKEANKQGKKNKSKNKKKNK